MAVSRSPWMGSVSLTDTNAHSLADLLDALPEAQKPRVNAPARVQMIAVQLDVSAGGKRLYIGGDDVTSTYCGVELVASQVWPIYSMDANLVRMDQIYVRASAGSQQSPTRVNVTFVTR